MKIGIVVPQGWTAEYRGWEPRQAWQRTLAVAQEAERLGFDSVWVFDHFLTSPSPLAEITFEAMTTLTALAGATRRVRLGQLVLCAGYRNPALVAKMVATLDVISGGRVELGIGAGWHEPEYRAFGYPFPPLRDRLDLLADELAIFERLLGSRTGDPPGAPGSSGREPATYLGSQAQIVGAYNLPRGLQQPRLPIIVGGNGPKVTWRLAARYADELNLDGLEPAEVVGAMPLIRRRCEEIGRDPDSLAVSTLNWSHHEGADPITPEYLAAYRDAGLRRLMLLPLESVRSDGTLERVAQAARSAGLELRP